MVVEREDSVEEVEVVIVVREDSVEADRYVTEYEVGVC